MLRHRRAALTDVDPNDLAQAAGLPPSDDSPASNDTGTGTGTGTGTNSGTGSGAKSVNAVSSTPASTPNSTANSATQASASASHSIAPSQTTNAVSKSLSPPASTPSATPSNTGGQSIAVTFVTSTSLPPTPTATSSNLPTTQIGQLAQTSYYTQYTTTNSDGQVYTVTNLVAGPGATGGTSAQSSSHTSFFQNKGAVAATFIIVGLAGAACLIVGLMFLHRRHRQREFERDAVLTTEHAARTTRVPPTLILDDEDDAGGGFSIVNRQPQMTQRNVGYGGGYGGTGYGGGAGSGVAGFGASSAVAGVGLASRRDNSPPPNDYYNSMPYGADVGAQGQPQPIPAFSHSSHGDEYDEYAGAAGWNAPYIGEHHDAGNGTRYQGDYYSQQQQPQQQPSYQQRETDAYGGYDQRTSPPPGRGAGGRAPIQPQNLYVSTTAAGPGGASQESAGTSNYGRNLTPDVPPGQGGNGRGGAGSRRSLMDDASSAKSYYSDEDEPVDLQPKRSLRIANL